MCAIMFYKGRKVWRTRIKSWHERSEVTLRRLYIYNAADLFQKLFLVSVFTYIRLESFDATRRDENWTAAVVVNAGDRNAPFWH